MQESKQWERLPFKMCKLGWLSNSEKLQELEMKLLGMELALSTIPSYPIQNIQKNQALKDDLNALENQITLDLNQANACSSSPSDSLTFPEINIDDDTTINTVKSIKVMPTDPQDLPHHCFIFCMKLLQKKSQINVPTELQESKSNKKDENPTNVKKTTWVSSINSQRLIPPLKFAISMGFAVFLGLMYSTENGFWASLAVAVSITSDREATFRVANIKVHGTMLGSVYGILCFVLFQEFLVGRLFCLVPWFIFTSFLQKSEMYGSSGGICAIVGAVVVLGRTNYGSPTEFAFARAMENFIGILVSILVDILLQPMRASKMAKFQLTLSLQTLQNCFEFLSFESSTVDLDTSQRNFRFQVSELKKLIDEADIEPKFWFLPFQSSCYGKLFKSLSKMADFFAFYVDAMNNLKQSSLMTEDSWAKVEGDVEKFKEMVNVLMTCFVDLSLLKCLKVVEKEVEKIDDLEMGETGRIETEETIEKEKLVNLFLQHSVEVVDEGGESKDGKSEVILSLSAVAFCLSGLMKEMEEIGEAIRELIQWENPSTHVDFNTITSKIHVVQK